ncbi:sensor histidine kinase [Pseudarthrobacter enclensis]|uniref:sensor histidine kinase n=1 Tax=Pseudarthrobacter enclensis TaxID=993070 RepID=UPI003684D821
MLFDRGARYFRMLGRRGRTVLFQLPLSGTMLLVILLASVLHPDLKWSAAFVSSLVFHAVLLAACAAVPWDRLPERAVLAIPVLDCLAIGLSREAGDQYLSVLSFLLVFPVVWLSYGPRRSGVVLAVLAAVLSVAAPPMILGSGYTSASFIRIVLLPVILGAIALTAFGVANALRLQRRRLEEREAEVRELLSASEHREQLLATVMDTVSVGVWALDLNGRTVLTNRHDGSWPGLPEEQGAEGAQTQVFGIDRKEVLPPEQYPHARAARRQPFTDELVWIGSGTSQRAYSATCRLVPARDGGQAGAVLALTDVTALVEALSAKDQFVASVSHELRTPLTSILGYLSVALDEEGLDADLVHCLDVAKRNAERLLNLVADLLTIASDRLTIQPREADLAHVAAQSVESAQPRARAGGVTVTCEAVGPAAGSFDPDRLGQAVDNLVSNAIKYTPRGGTVTVRVGTDNGNLVCTVTDTGVGMTEEDLDRAFTRFFRAANAHSSAIPGAGLGLAITRSIVENHRGTVTLSSAYGKGTTATLTLPVAHTDVLAGSLSPS